MKQKSLTDGFEKYRNKTRKEQFLDDMEVIIPWKELCDAIEPFYPNPKGAGRRPIGIERMLRIHFLQHWFNLSDPAAEKPSTIPAPCAASLALTLARSQCPTKPQFASSAT